MDINQDSKVVFISSISSDIGIGLANRYHRDGFEVFGTYRSEKLLYQLKNIEKENLFFCDLSDRESIEKSIDKFKQHRRRWDIFVSCAAWPPPLVAFFEADFEQWNRSIHINAIEQLRVLHALYPHRNPSGVNSAVFFAGPGTNNAPKNFSAVTLSKIMLMKMCELLDAENEDLNPFIIGPGWTRTKTHQEILLDPNVSAEKKRETEKFLKSDKGTSMDDIYDSILWLIEKGKKVAGGRNFSVVHDAWGEAELVDELLKNQNMYKLRRSGNDWRERQ